MQAELQLNNKFARLGEKFFTRLDPTPFAQPTPISFNTEAAKLIGIGQENYAEIFCGKQIPQGAEFLASVYAGHQFGNYVPQLGDGRAHYMGEVNGWEIQLKGSGKTPYSRFGDGRAVLRSSIREYLCSEALHNLGIPTTRALCIVGSDEPVQREEIEPAAMVTRLAPSFIRFGHFEYFYYTGQLDELKTLADFVVENYYGGASYDEFFEELVLRTARLMAKWQAAGWCHGVMNTDNFSILGLTLDYGPFGFIEKYDPHHICNHSDDGGRYAYDQQPHIGFWNLNALAQALSPLIKFEKAVEILQKYQPELAREYLLLMRAKLGFKTEHEEDQIIVRGLLDLLEVKGLDYTNFFRNLPNFTPDAEFESWFEVYKARRDFEQNPNFSAEMAAVNPKYILRNYLAQNAIAMAEQGDYSEIDKLLNLLQKPFDEQPENEAYAAPQPEGSPEICVSCSS